MTQGLATHARDAYGEPDLERREQSVAVCLPAREEAATVGAMAATLADMRDRGLIDEVLVIDAASNDGTARVAAAAGAEVHQRADLAPEFGPSYGKGDAIWRAQAAVDADILCFFDADLANFDSQMAVALIAPLLADPGPHYVKGAFERPLRVGEVVLEAGGGRVTELTARPLLRAFYPDLGAFGQPLSGQFAIRSDLLASLALPAGYGVDLAVLIGVYRSVGLAAMAQADLGTIETRHQGLPELSAMASAVLETLLGELVRDGRIDPAEIPEPLQPERPPYAALHPAARGTFRVK